VYRRGLSLSLLTKLTAANPARVFGLYPRKGTLRVGADADLVMVDPDAEWTIQASELFAQHKHTPYHGRRIRGRVQTTVVRGRVVYHAGEVKAPLGYGQLIHPANTL